ncbi:MAG: hypothetical protein ACRCWD_08325 [Culicoidibacterales bacterium]
MNVKLFDYGLLTAELCATYQIEKVAERAVGFGKLFTDGEKPSLLPDGDDNDKFYGALYECTSEAIGELAKVWPDYQQAEIMAYTAEGTFTAVAFVQTKQQIQKLTYLEYPEWRKNN